MDRTTSKMRGASFVGRNLAGPLLMVLAGVPGPRAMAQDVSQPEGVEVLTQGPVHEAFAVPIVNDPKAGLVVPKTPPAPVEEMPPDQKPSGPNVQWISGYWSWDESRNDFIWISGIWREPPPGRQWVPGYWNPASGGFQWIPGAWIPVGQDGAAALQAGSNVAQGAAEYLPPPPASLEVGPSGPAPSGDVFWSPGCWYWRQNRYVWRPGFWALVQPAWVWIPAHYVWTPGGCLFVEGYWDLPLIERGLLFAPVYYAQPVYLRPAYVYTPTITIATPGLVANLFVQPRYNHYCFGDYYDQRFLTAGIFPWFSVTVASGPRPPAFYDPLFTYYASINVRRDPRWAAHGREAYILRRDNVAMRPPRTYVEQTRIVQRNVNITNNVTIVERGGRPGGTDQMLGRPIAQVATRQAEAGAVRMERVNAESRQQWQAQARRLSEFRAQRSGQEREVRVAVGGDRSPQAQPRPRPFAMPNSPVGAPLNGHASAGPNLGPMRRPRHTTSTDGPSQPRIPRLSNQSQAKAPSSPVHGDRIGTPQPRIAPQDVRPADRIARQPRPRSVADPGRNAPPRPAQRDSRQDAHESPVHPTPPAARASSRRGGRGRRASRTTSESEATSDPEAAEPEATSDPEAAERQEALIGEGSLRTWTGSTIRAVPNYCASGYYRSHQPPARRGSTGGS